jgi:hypothetical protein
VIRSLRMPTCLVLCAVAFLVLPAQAGETPDSYSTRLPILTTGAMPYYRLSMPLQAYLASARGDLRDLRIFDASGRPVPHARLAVDGNSEQSVQRDKLPWFPLRAAANRLDRGEALNVIVSQSADGTLVEIGSRRGNLEKPREDAKAASLRGYLLDASKIADRRAVSALELDWEKTGNDFQLLDLESSDDLQRWHSLATGVQLARLDFNGARIENRRIDLPGFRDRYLRLIWREPANAPALTLAELEQSRSRYRAAPLVWSTPMAANATGSDLKPGEYRFHLARPLPLARLRIQLAPGNQLLPVEVLAPGRERHHWGSLVQTVVYRIQNNGREWSNDEILLPGYPLQEFVLRIDPRLSPPAQGLQLAFALRPEQIVFLAVGKAPYTLAVGNKDATDAALDPATLVPGFGNPDSPEIADATLDETVLQRASGATASLPAKSQEPEQDWKKMALWSVLVLGVLGMAAMAWQLAKQLKAGDEGK